MGTGTTPRRIYISGPITGHERTAARRFAEAAGALEGAGYKPVNPCGSQPPGTPYGEAMRGAIGLLIGCDGVALLDGWHGSRGCMAELAVASAIEVPVRPIAQWAGEDR